MHVGHARRHQRPLGALVLALALLGACAKSGGGDNGVGGDTGGGLGGAGGDTGGLKLATGGPYGFPQHRVSGSCTLTNAPGSDSATQSAYQAWRAAYVTSDGASGFLRVHRTNNGAENNDTVSEGIGYGMIASVYMNDRTTFDGLWQYGKLHFNSKGLMSWHLTSTGAILDAGSASDGDSDMIWALIMASDQWVSQDYLTAAANMIAAMRQNSIAPDGTLKPGDTWGGTSLTNPSYFSPAYYRVFAVVAGDPNWSGAILDRNYSTLAKIAGSNGLVPDWTNNSGAVNTTLTENGKPFNNATYSYDATRTPWRIAMDWCWNGEPRAHDYLTKIGVFFNGVGATNIVDGYGLNGSVSGNAKNMAFIGPAGVSGMAGYQSLLDGAFTYGANGSGDQSYYPASLRMITMLMMSGNFLDFTK